jgi:hypothetical protein
MAVKWHTNCYLIGDLSHKVFMRQPELLEGCEACDCCDKQLACKLNKTLYGLKQLGANEWNMKLLDIYSEQKAYKIYNQSRNDLNRYTVVDDVNRQLNDQWVRSEDERSTHYEKFWYFEILYWLTVWTRCIRNILCLLSEKVNGREIKWVQTFRQ